MNDVNFPAIIEAIQTKSDFEDFLLLFHSVLKNNQSNFSQIEVAKYIASMHRYCSVLEEQYKNGYAPTMQTNPSWKVVAELLFAAAIQD